MTRHGLFIASCRKPLSSFSEFSVFIALTATPSRYQITQPKKGGMSGMGGNIGH
jgi:hypothetical protein